MDSTDFLVVGDSRSSSVRHEVPLGVTDSIGYAEYRGRRYLFASSFELARIPGSDDLEAISFESLGTDRLLAEGKAYQRVCEEAIARGCARIGLEEAVTPPDFPLGTAEALRAAGVKLRPDAEFFEDRRRAKTQGELEGLRRGAATAEAALAAMRERISAPEPTDTEELRAIARRVFADHRAIKHEMRTLIACGPQGADPHMEGEGPIVEGQPIVIDIFPRDLASGCWGDFTRTLCKGEPPERLRRYHADVCEAQKLAIETIRPGVSAAIPNNVAAECLAAKGHPTRLGRAPGEMPTEGFIHAVGHGVGLDVHEAPLLDEGSSDVLVVGDVVTIEPGVYYRDLGGVRVEDVVLVTADGYELLNSAPYDLVA